MTDDNLGYNRPLPGAMKAVLALLPEAPAPGVPMGEILPVPGYTDNSVSQTLSTARRAGLVERVGYQNTPTGPSGTYAIWRRIPPALVVPLQPDLLTDAMRNVVKALPVAPAEGIILPDVVAETGYRVNTVRRLMYDLTCLGLAERTGFRVVAPGRRGPKAVWRRPEGTGDLL